MHLIAISDKASLKLHSLTLIVSHKLSLSYAIKNEYEFLVTIDVDFSPDPRQLPKLL